MLPYSFFLYRGWGICFPTYRFFFVDFWMWVYAEIWFFSPIGEILWGCPYLFFFGRGVAALNTSKPPIFTICKVNYQNNDSLENTPIGAGNH